ncbi:MAG: DUF2779 domain-containing protein [Flavobacteriaceae bacterium]|nr:DUF2779 domain-containing protein [Flavobacteriaceae bacterium]
MRVLSKSRYKLGLECPNKLFYTSKKEYANQKQEDPFLQALASGGFQVEELARLHYPDGNLIEDKNSDDRYDYEEKVNQTSKLLEHDNVVIFEAAFMFKNLFIRVDILEKKGDQINLIEVKAKSFRKDDVKYNSDWKFYLFDVAFQKYVIEKAFPQFIVKPFLMLADKDKTTTIAGLNQLFRVSKTSDNRTGIELKIHKLDNPEKQSVLSLIDVSDIIKKIELSEYRILDKFTFENSIQVLAKTYEENRYFDYDLNFQICKKCEFRTKDDNENLKSGVKECFTRKLGWNEDDFKDPTAFEIWDFRRWKHLNDKSIIKLEDIDDELFGEIKDEDGKMSRVGRQLTQKHKALVNDYEPHTLIPELKAEMDTWKFPLNFIDFEASTSPLPFYSGQHPYEKVVFQFSHHIYQEDGKVEHANEYINIKAGEFPNFEFVRKLKLALEQNNGTIFQFSPYENTTLNQVKVQLEQSGEQDRVELIDFIKSITTPPKSKDYNGELWAPTRGMVDLCEVIKAYYYNPYAKGSNSIKDILPATFKTSEFIRTKYTQPINEIELSSFNFKPDKVWLKIENGEVIDPYKSLDKPFKDWDDTFERVSDIEDINNGGAAMTAYGLTQYSDMTDLERNKIEQALLKYCELDTLAMVMIYEHLKEIITIK